MDQGTKEKIGASATEVFSTMYFMPVELMEELPSQEKWELESSYISAKIDFTGPQKATIQLFFPLTMAQNIAEGFLGVDPAEIMEKQMLDIMQEAANMVIGSFLGKADHDGLCTLGIPTAEFINDFTPDGVKGNAELMAFISDFGYMWLTYE